MRRLKTSITKRNHTNAFYIHSSRLQNGHSRLDLGKARSCAAVFLNASPGRFRSFSWSGFLGWRSHAWADNFVDRLQGTIQHEHRGIAFHWRFGLQYP